MTNMWEWYFKKMPGNDKNINFWRARKVKGLGFYRCTDDYMFSLDYGTDARLLEPGVLLDFEGKVYRVAAKQIAFVKKDTYASTKRLSPIYHIYLEDAQSKMHLYSEDSKKGKRTIRGGRIKKPRGAKTPEVKMPRELVRSVKPTKEEKLLAQHERSQAAKKRAEKRAAKKAAALLEPKPVLATRKTIRKKKRKKRKKRGTK
jgi:hypothetical protein